MALAFYELSGGADFVPRSELRREAAANGQTTTDTGVQTASLSDRPVTPLRRASEASASVQASPRTEPRPVSRKDAMAAIDTPVEATRNAGGVEVLTAAATPGALYSVDDSDIGTPEVTLVSLADNPSLFARPVNPDRAPEEDETMAIAPSMGSAMSAPVASAPDPARAPSDGFLSPTRDIRAVNGDLVNMRNGPGTNFSVLARLNRDTRVEVLADPGDGWVKLRPLNGGPAGWMADYLLTGS